MISRRDLPLALYLYGMNDVGQVVGGGDLTQGIVSPFIWQAGKVTVLPSKNKAAFANSISPNGEITARSSCIRLPDAF
jgi:uncharacterized membrane protein